MIHGSFTSLKEPLLYDEKEDRMISLRLMTHMYNFQTTQVGINQIVNSFTEKQDILTPMSRRKRVALIH